MLQCNQYVLSSKWLLNCPHRKAISFPSPFKQNQVSSMLQLRDTSDEILKALKVSLKDCIHTQLYKVCKPATSRMHKMYRQSSEETGALCIHTAPGQCRDPESGGRGCRDCAFLTGKTNVHMLKDIQSVLV